ncbi:DegQ family serine endoprotease [Tepidicella baoligensis]|uniref:DegQ family serine endoprotease n=1 Tax=Tepidicella baoligensis TaxID=2707016 RepID=UPI0015DB390D|nr:DegQ family serine endoprotease [Tepidicella baoligensis]
MPSTSVNQPWKRYGVAGAAALGLVAVLWAVNHGVVGAQPAAVANPVPPVTTLQPAPVEVRGLPDFTSLVEAVGPAVVNIRTIERVRRGAGPASPEEQMLEFFRRFGIPVPPGMVPRGPQPRQEQGPEIERPRGVGSGFILSADGYIMTNAHVVEGADQVIVTLPDKREFTAQVVGADRRTDVAVVKIEAEGLPAVRIGDVSRLRVGEWVIAIGSPFGLENTVTAGIVSAKQRDTGDYLPFIQTDVAINPGNSGGPLINMRGEVVGINSQIYSRSGGFQGISFAIPIDEAVRVSDQLRATGRVTRGRIGVAIDGVSRELADSLGLPRAEGALIRGVENNSPAALAGIEPGDVILSFDGKAVEKSSDLPRIVGNTAPGSKVQVKVWRRGAERTLTVTVGAFEDEQVARAGSSPAEAPKATKASELLGLTVRELSAAEKRELKVDGGVLIVGVQGPAARAGLREEDVIVGVGNRQIANMADFEAAVAGLPQDRPVNMLIRRGDWAQYALIRPDAR